MFDISFFELFVVGVVALIVIGPERLPKVARTAGHLFGRMQRYVNDVKADINREMELEELRKLRSEFEQTARGMEDSIRQVSSEVRAAESEIQQSVAAIGAEATGDAKPAADASADVQPAAQTENNKQ